MLRVAEHYAITDTGRQRRANEDSMLARSPLFVVADGMGGAQAGEVASKIAVETFGEGGEDFSDPVRALSSYAHAANSRIYQLSHRDASHAGMGTTMTALYVGEEEVTVAHVGDSRAYCLRDGDLLRLTDDHSLVDELIRQGRLTPEEAEEHPQRSIITRALGPEPEVEVDTRSFAAKAGDVYLICSDGLTSMLQERRLQEILRKHSRLRDAGIALVDAANGAGGRDNITAVLARLEQVDVESDGDRLPEHTTVVGMQPPEQAAGGPVEQAPSARAQTSATALAEAPARTPPVPRRMPRQGTPRAHRRRRRVRRAVAPMLTLAVLGLVLAAGYLALQSVFFIGTDSNGLVAVYRGVPYVLPGGIDLYSVDYVSGVSAAALTPQRRRALLDHTLRSEGNAAGLVRKLELGQISGG